MKTYIAGFGVCLAFALMANEDIGIYNIVGLLIFIGSLRLGATREM